MPYSFDECFANIPQVTPPSDLESFWKSALRELKSTPPQATIKPLTSLSSLRENLFEVSLQSYGNVKLEGTLSIPRRKGPRPVFISFHDYMGKPPEPNRRLSDMGVAQLFISLRGHGTDMPKPPPIQGKNQNQNANWTPGYFLENWEDPNKMYLKSIYLDGIRTIEFLKSLEEIDSEQIFLHGKSMGGGIALFSAAIIDKVKAIVLETPNLCHISPYQLNIKKSWMIEIQNLLEANKEQKDLIIKNLSYFDSVQFASKIKCPTLFTLSLVDDISNPISIMGLFHLMKGDKQMHVYPEVGNNYPLEPQADINVDFFKEVIDT